MKKLFLNYLHFVKSQILLTGIRAPLLIRVRILLGVILNIFLKPIQLVSRNFYFKLRKNFIKRIYKNIKIKIKNKVFYIRDDVDLMTLLADEGLDNIFEKGGKIFLDIGAHIGKYSILFADFYEKVYAFEPEPENFYFLRENIKLNQLENKIIPLQLAVSDKVGKINFYLSHLSVTHSLIGINDKNRILVDSYTLDKFLFDNNIDIENIACIKIDVEGAEHLVIKGMEQSLAKLKSLIVIEIWENNTENKKFITEFLKRFNFSLKNIRGDYYLAYYEDSSGE